MLLLFFSPHLLHSSPTYHHLQSPCSLRSIKLAQHWMPAQDLSVFLREFIFYSHLYFEFSASTEFLFSVLHFLSYVSSQIVPNSDPSHLHFKQGVHKVLMFWKNFSKSRKWRILLLHHKKKKKANLKYILPISLIILEISIQHSPAVYLWTSCLLAIPFSLPSHFSLYITSLPIAPNSPILCSYSAYAEQFGSLHSLFPNYSQTHFCISKTH